MLAEKIVREDPEKLHKTFSGWLSRRNGVFRILSHYASFGVDDGVLEMVELYLSCHWLEPSQELGTQSSNPTPGERG